MMVFVHFLENNHKVLSQILKTVPSVDDPIKIKGQKGKVIRVDEIKENVIHVHILYDPIIKKGLAADPKKKRR